MTKLDIWQLAIPSLFATQIEATKSDGIVLKHILKPEKIWGLCSGLHLNVDNLSKGLTINATVYCLKIDEVHGFN